MKPAILVSCKIYIINTKMYSAIEWLDKLKHKPLLAINHQPKNDLCKLILIVINQNAKCKIHLLFSRPCKIHLTIPNPKKT